MTEEQLLEAAMHLIEIRQFSVFLRKLGANCSADRQVLRDGKDNSREARAYLHDEELICNAASSIFEQVENEYEQKKRRPRDRDLSEPG